VLGAAETVVGLTERFRPHPDRRGLYMPNGKPANAATPRLAAAGGLR
jgi:chemotaxis protein methyltransferase CheR